MGLAMRPHSVTVQAASAEPDDEGIIQTPELGSSRAVLGQLTPMDPRVAFSDAGIVIERPHWLLVNLEDGDYFPNGALVVYGAREFYVVDTPIKWESGNSCDHASVKLSETVRA